MSAASKKKSLRKAVVLVSGGLDSATVLAIARKKGFECYALSFRYGQRHSGELAAAKRVARALGAREHKTLSLNLRTFGGSALTADLPVPKGRHVANANQNKIPITYVPARNTIFLSLALAWAEVLGASDIFIGVNALDYSGYPDCRPAFISAFQKLADRATRAGAEGSRFNIHAPLMKMDKAAIIRAGLKLGVDYGITTSCYDPGPHGKPCGRCDACQLRKKGFAALGLVDPV
ncbi:MAG: 7-cyano-7-deazaguanine synthase QueC [Kiritimatiellae bacterium]|nr:7-cyano-7-deazaguanine synthase QueC [Kiritimatiellia bacterium]